MFESARTQSSNAAEIDRLATQVRHLQSRSGRQAARLHVACPEGMSTSEVRDALRDALDAPMLEVVVETGRGRARVVTVEFELEMRPIAAQGRR